MHTIVCIVQCKQYSLGHFTLQTTIDHTDSIWNLIYSQFKNE